MRKPNLTLILILCLCTICNISCGKENTNQIIASGISGILAKIRLPAGKPEDILDDIVERQKEYEIAKNLRYLRDGNTEALVGLSFGDEFDYENYDIRAETPDEELYYGLKGSGYDSMYFHFSGKGNGFNGLSQYEGDFLGICVDEDTVDKIINVLGPCTTQTKEKYNWAVWEFETATLSVELEGITIQYISYLAKDGYADVPEKAEADTDLGKDRLAAKGQVETIYNWNAYGSETKDSYATCDPRDVDYDENTVSEFIQDYLRSQGISKTEPDKITYNQDGEPIAECYIDEEKGEYCIILHVWGEWLVDFDAGIRRHLDAIYCTTRTLGEEDIWGYAMYEKDEEENKVRERLYNSSKKKMADVTYEYIPDVPFPFILEAWNLDEFHPSLLIRNQKTWAFKEAAVFDATGKFVAYRGGMDEGGEYLPESCRTVYDENGRLEAVEEELLSEDVERNWGWWDETIDYSGQMKWEYREDGTVNNVEYIRSSYSHGTTDSSGSIEYDSRGRMLYNDYYITHGSDSTICLYDGDSDVPWCVLHWCCFRNGFEDIYLFLPKDNSSNIPHGPQQKQIGS